MIPMVVGVLTALAAVAGRRLRRRRRWRPPTVATMRAPPRAPGPSPEAGAPASVAAMCAEAVLDMLVVDDESELRAALRDAFTRDGHRVTAVADGRSAIDRASTERFDVVLLDVALGPGPDGYEVCRKLRRRRNLVPIIMLTARDSEADAVLGLEAGADDYVTKPFGLAELRSRIRAVLRRGRPARLRREVLRAGPVVLDRRSREVTVDGAAGRADVLGVRAAARAHGRARAAAQPPGAPARDLGRQRLPRPARHRRPHPPSAREARGGARAPAA